MESDVGGLSMIDCLHYMDFCDWAKFTDVFDELLQSHEGLAGEGQGRLETTSKATSNLPKAKPISEPECKEIDLEQLCWRNLRPPDSEVDERRFIIALKKWRIKNAQREETTERRIKGTEIVSGCWRTHRV